MKYVAEINVMPLREMLDPEGKTTKLGLNNLGIRQIGELRIGKHFSVEMEAENKEEAQQQIEQACKKLLANPTMETYEYQINEAE